MAARVVERVERVEEGMEHAVERVEEGIVNGVIAVANKIPHDKPPPPPPSKASGYIAPSPLESSASATTSVPPERPHTPPSLHRYEEMLADELTYQEELYPSVEDVPGCMTLL